MVKMTLNNYKDYNNSMGLAKHTGEAINATQFAELETNNPPRLW